MVKKTAKLRKSRRFVIKLAGPKGAKGTVRFTVKTGRGSRTVALTKSSFRLTTTTGRARLVLRVSRRTLRRLRPRTLKVSVVVSAAGQSVASTLKLKRPKR